MTAYNLYAPGTRVYIKALDSLGEVRVAAFHKKAEYIVALLDQRRKPTGEFATCFSRDLRAADDVCFACNRWLPHGSFNGGSQVLDGEYVEHVCFLCTTLSRRDWR